MAAWPTPVVRLNRAVAVARVHGPAAALESIAPLSARRELRDYAPFYAVRGELLRQARSREEAGRCFEQALACPGSEPQRRYFARLASRLRAPDRAP